MNKKRTLAQVINEHIPPDDSRVKKGHLAIRQAVSDADEDDCIAKVWVEFDGREGKNDVEPLVVLNDGSCYTLRGPIKGRLVRAAKQMLPDGWRKGHGALGEIEINMRDCTVRKRVYWGVEETMPLMRRPAARPNFLTTLRTPTAKAAKRK